MSPLTPKQLLLALLLLFQGAAAFAHPLPGTAAMLDFGRENVGLELSMPLDQFELGFKHPVMDAPERMVQRYPAELRGYLLAHIHPRTPDGRPWQVSLDAMRVVTDDITHQPDLVARLTLTPPRGAPLRQFRLDYSVINHEVMTHDVLVFARSDWNNGVFGGKPELLGTIRFTTTGIDIDRDAGSFWQGFAGVFRLGMEHIAEGTDHLLFLLVLLLPAPLLREGHRRWGGYIGARATVARLATLVTAFTLGHSLSLIASAYDLISVPAQPVEALIALSILVSAVHAWRPLLGGREGWVAAGFGLIHGLAFARVLVGGGLTGWDRAGAVLGFNLGIEVVQLLVVAIAAPWLMGLAQRSAYPVIRNVLAALAGAMALAWGLERITGQSNPVSGLLGDGAIVQPGAMALLAALSLLGLLFVSVREKGAVSA